MRLFDKIKSGLAKTRDGMKKGIDSLINSFTKIDDDLLDELEEILILSDIGAVTSQEIISKLRIKIKEKGISDPQQIKTELKAIISDMLGEFIPLDFSNSDENYRNIRQSLCLYIHELEVFAVGNADAFD